MMLTWPGILKRQACGNWVVTQQTASYPLRSTVIAHSAVDHVVLVQKPNALILVAVKQEHAILVAEIPCRNAKGTYWEAPKDPLEIYRSMDWIGRFINVSLFKATLLRSPGLRPRSLTLRVCPVGPFVQLWPDEVQLKHFYLIDPGDSMLTLGLPRLRVLHAHSHRARTSSVGSCQGQIAIGENNYSMCWLTFVNCCCKMLQIAINKAMAIYHTSPLVEACRSTAHPSFN